MNSSFVQTINDPFGQYERLFDLLSGGNGVFTFCVGSTETSEIEGISAAGATAASRRLTPSIDADVLSFGHPRKGESIPVSPVGIVSPVVISLTCLRLLKSEPIIVDCGTFRSPLKSNVTAGTVVSQSVSTGRALPLAHVKGLFEEGRRYASQQLVHAPGYLMLSECVPGGTTTALAVLTQLGVDADSLVSSSLPNESGLRTKVVQEGRSALKRVEDEAANASMVSEARNTEVLNTKVLNIENLYSEAVNSQVSNPFHALAAFGDPMQPFVAGAAIEAAKHIPVILGGGSQMLAVYYICNSLSKFLDIPFKGENVFVITTKWISADANSNTRRLSQLVNAPFFAANPDFNLSRFAGLRAYEEGHVKEGIGAGALMAAAALQRKLSAHQLMVAIDNCYDEIILRGNATTYGAESNSDAECLSTQT